MKDLIFICAQPSDLYYTWEVEVWLTNARKNGYSQNCHVLVYEPDEDQNRLLYREYWKKLQIKFSESKIIIYKDNGVKNLLSTYIPVLRPHILAQHFKNYPELEQKAIFYHDCDIIFTKKLDFSKFLNDDKCYLSDTKGYISSQYFDSKIKDVKPNRLEKYKTIDVLDQCCKLVGIDRSIAEKNINSSGGAQYLLKGVDYKFWQKVQEDSIKIRLHLQSINRLYFESESKGFQSWCADMWAVLWNLWLLNKETECPEEFNFSWATSPIEEYNKNYIYHNAGVSPDKKLVSPDGNTHHLFYKGDPMFKNNYLTPLDLSKDAFYNISDKFCSIKYVEEILSVEDPVSITKQT